MEENNIKDTSEKTEEVVSKSHPFIEKCKKDFVIPLCLIAAVLVIVAIVLRSIIPLLTIKTMGMSLTDFKTRYESTETFKNLYEPYGFDLPTQYIDSKDITSLEEGQSTDGRGVKYFGGLVIDGLFYYNIIVQGHVRSTDDQLMDMRVTIEYSNDSYFFTFLLSYLATYFQALYPEMTNDELTKAANDTITQGISQSGTYLVYGDYAFRIVPSQFDVHQLINFDITSAKAAIASGNYANYPLVADGSVSAMDGASTSES